jgi:hypothetical protein
MSELHQAGLIQKQPTYSALSLGRLSCLGWVVDRKGRVFFLHLSFRWLGYDSDCRREVAGLLFTVYRTP